MTIEFDWLKMRFSSSCGGAFLLQPARISDTCPCPPHRRFPLPRIWWAGPLLYESGMKRCLREYGEVGEAPLLGESRAMQSTLDSALHFRPKIYTTWCIVRILGNSLTR